MKKAIIIAIIVMAVAAAGIFFVFKYSDFIKKEYPNEVFNQISEYMIDVSEINKDANYKIVGSYPEFFGMKDQVAQKMINDNIKKNILDEVNKFKDDAKTACDFSNLPGGAPDWICEYDVGLESYNLVNYKILSIKMVAYRFAGGAHGGTTYMFLNYDFTTGKEIDWKDVFKKDSGYMQRIADYSNSELDSKLLSSEPNMSDADWIKNGTAPTAENYNTNVGFYSGYSDQGESRGLAIIFQQYQVAAYAQGISQVVIPYEKLEDLIDPNGLLGELAK